MMGQRRKARIITAAALAAALGFGTALTVGAIPINPGPVDLPDEDQGWLQMLEDYANDPEWDEQLERVKAEAELLKDMRDNGLVDPDVADVELGRLEHEAEDLLREQPPPWQPPAVEPDDDVDRDHLMTLDDYFRLDWNGRGWVG